MFNPVLQGWLTYYGRFYPSTLLACGSFGGISTGISSNGFGESSKDFRSTSEGRNSIWIASLVPIRTYSYTGNLAYSLVVRVIGAG